MNLEPEWEYRFYEHRFWEEGPILRNQDLYDNAERYHAASPWQFRADIARYEILYEQGGVWVDCDFEIHKPLDEYLDRPFAGWAVEGQVANNALLGFPPGHDALAEIIARLPQSVASQPRAHASVKSGPKFITPILLKYPDIWIYPEAEFYPIRWNDQHAAPERPIVHHYWNLRNGIYEGQD